MRACSQRLVWPTDGVDHIAHHGIQPSDVVGTCFGRALVLRAKSTGENPVYYVLGRNDAGRYIFCVLIWFPDGVGYPVTARAMTDAERRRYRRWIDP